jgi:hypothetical protein
MAFSLTEWAAQGKERPRRPRRRQVRTTSSKPVIAGQR